jgi:arsenate reductase (thioredoxin)
VDAGGPARVDARSKSWNEFSYPAAVGINVVVAVCDNAASEVCPHCPGPATEIHLPFPDPAAETGTVDDTRAAFGSVFNAMRPELDVLMAEL